MNGSFIFLTVNGIKRRYLAVGVVYVNARWAVYTLDSSLPAHRIYMVVFSIKFRHLSGHVTKKILLFWWETDSSCDGCNVEAASFMEKISLALKVHT